MQCDAHLLILASVLVHSMGRKKKVLQFKCYVQKLSLSADFILGNTTSP